MQWRYSVKKFDQRRVVPVEKWQELEQAMLLSPSAYGLQPWRFMIVDDPALRSKLAASSWGQAQITTCSHLVVMTARTKMDTSYVDNITERVRNLRGLSHESINQYRQMLRDAVSSGPHSQDIFGWATRQVYIALGVLVASAARLGIDTCPMEGFEPEEYDEILGLKGSDFRTVVVCAVGYRSEDDAYAGFKKFRFERSEVIQSIRN